MDLVAVERQHTAHFPELDRAIDCREGESLFSAARRAGLRIVGACGGRGACGTCIVRVTQGDVEVGGAPSPQPSPAGAGEGVTPTGSGDGDEGSLSRDSGRGRGVRADASQPPRKWLRACCVEARSDLTVQVAPRSLAPIVRADVRAGGDEVLALDAAVVQVDVQVDPASLTDLASDADRLRRALDARHGIAPASIAWTAARELPPLLRSHGWQVAVRLTADAPPQVVGIARPEAPLLGLAVDLGTTNAAAFLVDLKTGRRLASLGLENPQVAWGADLISRINHAIKDEATAQALRVAAVNAIQSLGHDLARSVGAEPADIADLVVCGNTAMQHLLAGWPVSQLGRAPFVAAMNESLDVAARDLGLQFAAGARVHLAPSIGGFVGGDHVTAMLATESLWTQPGTTLVMDIGTNTEISLVHDGRIWSASCPSGPALEGGHIGNGMRAADGAIERVRIDGDGQLQLQVIGGGEPIGLCGSGVLDALAAFVRAGWVDARGRIAAARATADDHGSKAILIAAETPDAPAVRFSQHDVRAVQLAKSAIRTGVKLLCAEAGMDESTIDRFVIAGAFGAYIAVDSGIAIGLFPPLARERFAQVGNAAGLGVQQMLASRERRGRAARLARECRYVELSGRTDFQKTFLHHIGF